MVFVIIHIPWPISMGLDPLILHVYARLLPCFMFVLASLVLGFAMLDTLRGFMVVWLHPMPTRPCLGVTTWDASSIPSCFVCALPFLTPCDDMLTTFAYATRWLSFYLYMLAYMSMHESCLLVSHPCFNTMKLWTFHPNLHLSHVDTTSCVLSCLFSLLFVCFLSPMLCLPYL